MHARFWIWQELTANASRWRDATVSAAGLGLWPASHAHAVTDVDGETRVVIIAKDVQLAAPLTTTVRLPCANRSACRAALDDGCTAVLVRLRAAGTAGLAATAGISFAGLTYDSTQDGTPSGTRQEQPVALLAADYWLEARFSTPAASLALLTLRGCPAHRHASSNQTGLPHELPPTSARV